MSRKITLFSVFAFLRDAMSGNVTSALAKLGGSRGTNGPVEIELKVRTELADGRTRRITYELHIDERNGRPVVTKEVLRYKRGNRGGRPWKFLDFANGTGVAVTNELDSVQDESLLTRETQTLKSPDILATKGLAPFERFPAVVVLGNLIENWHLSDFHISRARPEAEAGYAEHLSREGENLSLVVEYLHNNHRKLFDEILDRLKHRVPGVTTIKGGMASRCAEAGRPDALVRVACRELESFFVGDWQAVSQAFGKPALARLAGKAAYRQPDALGSPSEELARHLPGYQKRDGARRIAPLIEPSRNTSRSYHALREAVLRMKG